ncbi:hypothetical protein E3Q23_01912 [Wallemia mellicola]|uniref:NUC189-domain-containing protein n=2 Tax=Wallemia mellicola TaxID=1708541 RepID=A0A4T0PQ50_9BASI|nr:hypothetical protein E3Q23_01912 [Wallemia mellicola]TIB80090.1 NUC189-domain-containing protein [Wallemia mellicola]TIB84026.1 NUC189-domain-containing protein [Wallemia mellicola]TIB92613.1 NUC189-domain-containing protein [Wallemia mellicola]TIC01022.1 NUC189-domain-containing protein [Wallemia mellicola]
MDFINNKLYADVEDPGSGTVLPGVGTAEFVVKYTAIVYKPFKGEVVDGQVASVNKMGFFADVGPLQVFVSSHLIPQDIKFDPSSNPACFSSEDQVIEKGSKVRLKIVGTRVDATEIYIVVDRQDKFAFSKKTSMSSPIKKKSKQSQQPVAHTSIYKSQSDQNVDEHAQLPTDNLAELSLGQRLKASSKKAEELDGEEDTETPALPVNSLATLLTQSLNSNDTNLLESCLGQTDASIIRNTVDRLPSQLAIPLLHQCTTRLAKPGKAGPQRAKGLLEWSRAVLTIHTAYLLSMPNVTEKLLGLHSALSQRISSHEKLMGLSGRLDVVLSQIALQRSIQEERRSKEQNKKSNNAVTYIEGDSDEEDNVEYDNDDAEAIEDVELGNGEDESDSESGEEVEDDEEIDNSLDGDDSDRNAMVEDEAIEEDDDSDDDDEEDN